MAKRSLTGYRGGRKHIRQEDAFTKGVQKIYEYYTRSPLQAILTTVAVLGIIVVGSILFSRVIGGGPPAPPLEATIGLNISRELMTKDLQAAEDTLRSLVMRHSGNLPGKKGIYYLGQVLFMQGRYDEALEEFTRFEKTYPVKNSVFRPAALLAQGNCLENQGRYQEAAERYLELPKRYPDAGIVPDACLAAGRCLILLKDYDRAESVYNKITKDYPEDRYYYIYRKALGALGQIDALRNMF